MSENAPTPSDVVCGDFVGDFEHEKPEYIDVNQGSIVQTVAQAKLAQIQNSNNVKTSKAFKPMFRRPSTMPIVSNDVADEPTLLLHGTSASSAGAPKIVQTPAVGKRYFLAVHAKCSSRKHKKWEGDAVLQVEGRALVLYDVNDARVISKVSNYSANELAGLCDGSTLIMGGREVEVQEAIHEAQFLTGECFLNSSARVGPPAVSVAAPVLTTNNAPSSSKRGFSAPGTGVNAQFCNPQLQINGLSTKRMRLGSGQAMFDVSAPNALVMPAPPDDRIPSACRDLTPTPVVVDPRLTHRLRPHQREGVTFLYECMMGFRGVTGAILADDMGMGKSVQTIALIWTLYKQGPYGGRPVIRRALLVCPCSLVSNWSKEVRKWLGDERIKTYSLTKATEFREYKHMTHVYPILITSYEMATKLTKQLAAESFDILVCDEAHRLKNQAIRSTCSLSELGIKRRILLTGTPLQNDLNELHAMCDFACPDVLGSAASFKRCYERPIVLGQRHGADRDAQALCKARRQALVDITNTFMLRRRNDINEAYLPRKDEYTVFCRLSDIQQRVYARVVGSRVLRSILYGDGVVCGDGRAGAPHLGAIDTLRKVCNHPALLCHAIDDKEKENKEMSELYKELSDVFPSDFMSTVSVEQSGKMAVLCDLIAAVQAANELADDGTYQKIVVVSNYTTTLRMMCELCTAMGYRSLMLTGDTTTVHRQAIVEQFNRKEDDAFVLLLSSKAGGTGLNLIGANRIVLYDVDWNPANDAQALARVWRDGQTLPVSIYRLVHAGTIEEKMLQRQMSKLSLSHTIMSGADAHTAVKSNRATFTIEELRDIFTLDTEDDCPTHSLAACPCRMDGSNLEERDGSAASSGLANMHAIKEWRHYSRDSLVTMYNTEETSMYMPNGESMLRQIMTADESAVTFVLSTTTEKVKIGEGDNQDGEDL